MGQAVTSLCNNPVVDDLPDARKKGGYLLSDHYSVASGSRGTATPSRMAPTVDQHPVNSPLGNPNSALQSRGGYPPSSMPNAPAAYQQPPYQQPPSQSSTSGTFPPHDAYSGSTAYPPQSNTYEAPPPDNDESNTVGSAIYSAVTGLLGGGSGEWDSAAFLKQLQEARASGNKHAEKKVLQAVAESNYALRSKWKVPRTVAITAERCATTRVAGKGKDPVITFSNLSTGDAVLALARNRQKRICALNFANGEHVGGGYKTGATAQEEDLCRRIPSLYSTLYNASRSGLYPFGPCTLVSLSSPAKYSDVLFTKGLVVARSSVEQGYNLLLPNEQATVSLVTAAAPNINFAKEVYNMDLMYKTVKAIFVAPLIEEPGLNTLILGAWGCGAFGGSPEEISELFARAIKENMGRLYDEVHFAIPAGHNADVFRNTLRKHNLRYTELR